MSSLATRALAQSNEFVGTFFSSFDKDFQDVAKSIKLHSQNVDWAAHTAHIEETQREAEKAKVERRGTIST